MVREIIRSTNVIVNTISLLEMRTCSERLASINQRLLEAAKRAGRGLEEVELIAVSKTYPHTAIREMVEAGQMLFGESRVQEAKVKIPLLPSQVRWHFIGHLQRNKVRQALPLFEMFHGIDSMALASDINRIAAETGAHPRILLEVNLAGEASKFGFTPDSLCQDFERLLGLERVQVEGLMIIPPVAENPEDSRRYFAALRGLRDSLQNQFQVVLPHLSMGMSSDFEVAVEEGATLVRVGTALFGERKVEG